MSSEKLIIDFIDAKITSITNGPKKSRHFYDLARNDEVKNDFIYAIRPGSAQRTSGTIQAITYQQDFEIEIASDYVDNDNNDLKLQTAVEKIEAFAEELIKLFKIKVSPITLILPPTKSAPEVNQNKKSVSRIYTFEITYRVHL